MKKPVALVILDGFGYRKEKKYNAIKSANTPFIDYLFKTYPHALLKASGAAVGLPEGFAGNSEVGHITIGAGKRVEQPLTLINRAIEDASFFKNPILVDQLQKLSKTDNTLHLIGLLSDAGVHSHLSHLFALLQAAHHAGIKKVVIHAILDGRDTPPRSAKQFLSPLLDTLKKYPEAELGSLSGRFYAMDRNKNWDRTKKVYDMLINSTDHQKKDVLSLIDTFYKEDTTDEFIPPTKISSDKINSGDGVIFFNFRPDRMRQLNSALSDQNFSHFKTVPLKLSFVITMVPYSNTSNALHLYENPYVEKTLKTVLCKNSIPFLSIAETEKYAHVTYFLGGGTEKPCKSESQILVPSITAKTYEQYPCMSAPEITKTVCEAADRNVFSFFLINYANADMVGHSGNMQATIKAVECLDTQLQKLYENIAQKHKGILYITADHGNAELMYDEHHQQPHTAHTDSPVPFIMVSEKTHNSTLKLPLHELADIAPFIIKNMEL